MIPGSLEYNSTAVAAMPAPSHYSPRRHGIGPKDVRMKSGKTSIMTTDSSPGPVSYELEKSTRYL